MNETFSVSMCVYHGDDAGHFADALQSVIDQTLQPNEIVLTVDGSIPTELETVIDRYQESLADTETAFKVVRLPENKGHGEARRACLENCSNEYIALMDADDLSLNDRFERQMEYIRNHPEVSAVGGNISEFVGDPENVVGKRIVPSSDADIKAYMKNRCPMNQVTVMLTKSSVLAVGGYLDWYCDEDYYLWLRMALAGMKFGNISEILVNVRVGDEMYSRRGGMRYFKSEAKLQRYMLDNKLISWPRYAVNVGERLVLQVLMPNKVRGWVFQRFARESN